MDPTFFRLASFAIAAVTVITVVKIIANGVMRLAAHQRALLTEPRGAEIEARLDRLETAIDAVAIELERIGEHQRFAAQLAARAAPKATVVARDESSGRARP